MSRQLEDFRDHCQRMADPATRHVIAPSEADRLLFAALAAEIDEHLERPAEAASDDTPLWEED